MKFKIKPWLILGFLLLVSAPKLTLADGLYFPPPFSTEMNPVDMGSQMAVITIHLDGNWEMCIRTSYTGDPQEFGWVIPFPDLPEVNQNPPKADFFKDIDTITSIWFITENCECYSDSYGCGAAYAGGSSRSEDTHITVWEAGSIEGLDYVIVSSTEGGSISEWLVENGFTIPPDAQPLLQELSNEGYYFFAARVNPEGYGSVRNITPMCFNFSSATPIFYPMRLTSSSSADSIAVTIWIFDESGKSFIPSNYPWDFIEGEGEAMDELTRVQYELKREEILSRGDKNTFIVEYSSYSDQEEKLTLGDSCWFYEVCYSYDISERVETMYKWGKTRLFASIPPEKLTEDVEFEPAQPSQLKNVRRVYSIRCPSDREKKCLEKEYQFNCSQVQSRKKQNHNFTFFIALVIISAIIITLAKGKGRKNG